MMKRMLLLAMAAFAVLVGNAQLLTWSPAFPKETDNITITVDATKGNKGLQGFNGDVYVHIGAITNLSTGPSNWLHAPFTWGSTAVAAKATAAGTNKWSFTVNNPRSFFGLAAGETLRYIAILFRKGGCTDDCSKQANADGSDMYVPIYTDALAVRIDNPPSEPKYAPTPELQNWIVGTNFSITANASKPSAMKLYHNGTVIASGTSVQTLAGNSTVTAIGNQKIVAEANDGTSTQYDTLDVFVSPAGSPEAPLPAGMRDGINYESGTTVTLVLRAPGKNKAVVIGDFNSWTPQVSHIMNKTPDGKFFWVRLEGLTSGTEYAYQYVVDDNIKIADPYAEKVLDPNNDQFISAATYPGLKPYPAGQTGIVGVFQPGKPAYNWAVPSFTRPDKRGLVVYELLLRDFVAAHNWKTLQDSLDYLKTLGINAIELMPFNEFEGNESWGYNPSFYFAPDKYYGTETALKTFIDSCHKKGIAVIMDIALNHSFGQSPMVQLYWDGANNRPAANNPWYNPVAKHAFNVGFDFNHNSNDTKYFVSRVVEHWLQQYKIDGFRFDLSKGFTQTQTCDNNGNNCNVGQWSAYDASRVALWKAYYDTTQLKSPNSYVILEHLSEDPEEKELSDYGMLFWGHLNHQYSQASMGHATEWDFSRVLHTSRGFTKPHLVAYMESHDEERMMFRNLNFGNVSGGYNIKDTATALKRIQMSASFFFTVPGPKMLWQFGELGYDYSINHCPNGTISNDCRLANKPIRWDYLNDSRRKEVYQTFSKLINLRHHSWYREAFLSGAVTRDFSGPVKWMRVNSGDTSQIVVIGNFDVASQFGSVTFPTSGTWFDYLQNTPFTATGTPQSFSLQPGQFYVFVNRNVANVATTPVANIPWNGTTLEAKVFPNPVITSGYTIELKLPQSGAVTIDLYNVLGQYVHTVHKGFLTQGTRRLSIGNNAPSKGNYYLKVQTKSETKTIQVTIQ